MYKIHFIQLCWYPFAIRTLRIRARDPFVSLYKNKCKITQKLMIANIYFSPPRVSLAEKKNKPPDFDPPTMSRALAQLPDARTVGTSTFSVPNPARSQSLRQRCGPIRRRRGRVDAAEVDLDSLLPPDIDGDLEGLQEEAGAIFGDDGFVLNFGSVEEELRAIESSAAVIDRSDWGIVRVNGPGAAAALRAIAKSDDTVELTSPGTGFEIELKFDGRFAQIYAQNQAFLVIVPPSSTSRLLSELASVPEQQFMELNDKCALLTVVGPKTNDILGPSGLAQVLSDPVGSHCVFGFENRPVIAARTAEYRDGVIGLNLIVDEGIAGQVWATITRAGVTPAGSEASNARLAR